MMSALELAINSGANECKSSKFITKYYVKKETFIKLKIVLKKK